MEKSEERTAPLSVIGSYMSPEVVATVRQLGIRFTTFLRRHPKYFEVSGPKVCRMDAKLIVPLDEVVRILQNTVPT